MSAPSSKERTTLPILSGVLLDATAGSLKLTATDMDVEIVETVDVDYEGEWHIVVPGRLLLRLVENMTAADLEIAELSGRLIVQAKYVAISIGSVGKAADFPRVQLELSHRPDANNLNSTMTGPNRYHGAAYVLIALFVGVVYLIVWALGPQP